ncbi:MAG: hypothetical protein AB1512_20790 [Thermodesulfobacteriota bacterium]
MGKRTILCMAVALCGAFFLFQPAVEAQGMRGGMMGGGYGMMGPAWGRGAWMGPGYWRGSYGYSGYGYNPGYGQAAAPSGAARFAEETSDLRERIDKKSKEVEDLIGQEKPDKDSILAAHRELLNLQSQLEQRAMQYRLENMQPAGPTPYGRGYGTYPAWGGSAGAYPTWAGGQGWGSGGLGLGCPCDSWGYPAYSGAYTYGPSAAGQELQNPAGSGGESTQSQIPDHK